MNGSVDFLAFGAHPDDVELAAGGTLAKAAAAGYKCAIVDLTAGELGTRGSGSLRLTEAAKAAEILGVAARENLGLADGFFDINPESLLSVIRAIRSFRPTVVIANSSRDRHPDHAKGSELVTKAAFYSGLRKIETVGKEGSVQQAHRPRVVYHSIQDYYTEPALVVDITGSFEVKMSAIRAFSSQFYNPESPEPNTPISGAEFVDFLRGRAMQFGRPCGFLYGEGFTVSRPIGVEDLHSLL